MNILTKEQILEKYTDYIVNSYDTDENKKGVDNFIRYWLFDKELPEIIEIYTTRIV